MSLSLIHISPITDYSENLLLEFVDYTLEKTPKYSVEECKERDVNYAAPLRVLVRLINKETGEVKEQEVFMGDFPLMTEQGTFIINGAERVIVSQLVRSPGVYYDVTTDKSGKQLYSCLLYTSSARRPSMSVGMGFDAHRLTPDRKLILGGVEIAHPLGLLGHSDADVLTHARCV